MRVLPGTGPGHWHRLGVKIDPKTHFYFEFSDFDFSELCHSEEDWTPQKKENKWWFIYENRSNFDEMTRLLPFLSGSKANIMELLEIQEHRLMTTIFRYA